jgi:hypothetical protein
LRTNRDVESTATVLGRPETDIRDALRDDSSEANKDPDAPETIEMRGRVFTLPKGVTAADAREIMKKRRNDEALTDEEQKLMRSIFQSGGTTEANNTGKSADYRFGGEFWVVIDSDKQEIRKVLTGVTDLSRVEIISGLDENERVLILPSSHLLETQQDLQNFIKRRVGVPGIR